MSTDREPTYDKLMRLAQTIYAIRTNIHKQKQLEAQQQKEEEAQAAEQQRMGEFLQSFQPQSATVGAPAPVMPQQPTQIGMGMGIGQQQPQMGMGMQVPAFQPQAPGIPQHQINLGTPEPQNAMRQAAMGDPFMAAQLLGDKGMQNIFAPEAQTPEQWSPPTGYGHPGSYYFNEAGELTKVPGTYHSPDSGSDPNAPFSADMERQIKDDVGLMALQEENENLQGDLDALRNLNKPSVIGLTGQTKKGEEKVKESGYTPETYKTAIKDIEDRIKHNSKMRATRRKLVRGGWLNTYNDWLAHYNVEDSLEHQQEFIKIMKIQGK